MERIARWTGDQVEVCRSSGTGVPYVTRWKHNVIRPGSERWPDWLLKQVRGYVARPSWFGDEDAAALAEDLGAISKFQSIRSEDAVTWSWFGTLALAEQTARLEALAWLYERLDISAPPSPEARIDQWPRVVHPNAPGSPNGPEVDARIDDPDGALIYIEAKWAAGLGTGRGASADQLDDQVVLRRDSMRKDPALASDVDRSYVVLGVSNQRPDLGAYDESGSDGDAPRPVAVRWMTWADLAECDRHPHAEEFARYLGWKHAHDPS